MEALSFGIHIFICVKETNSKSFKDIVLKILKCLLLNLPSPKSGSNHCTTIQIGQQ